MNLAERSFDLRTSGLWAQHASTAPLCSINLTLKVLVFELALFNYRLLLCDSCCKAISFTLVIFAIATFAHDLPLNLRLIQKVRCDYGTIPNLINPFCH